MDKTTEYILSQDLKNSLGIKIKTNHNEIFWLFNLRLTSKFHGGIFLKTDNANKYLETHEIEKAKVTGNTKFFNELNITEPEEITPDNIIYYPKKIKEKDLINDVNKSFSLNGLNYNSSCFKFPITEILSPESITYKNLITNINKIKENENITQQKIKKFQPSVRQKAFFPKELLESASLEATLFKETTEFSQIFWKEPQATQYRLNRKKTFY